MMVQAKGLLLARPKRAFSVCTHQHNVTSYQQVQQLLDSKTMVRPQEGMLAPPAALPKKTSDVGRHVTFLSCWAYSEV